MTSRAPLVVVLAALLGTGCALTDYGDPADFGVHNKSHGVLGCATDDRIANTQQTLEPRTRELRVATSFGGPANGCPDLGALPEPVTPQDARDWNRFIGDYAFVAEARLTVVTGPTSVSTVHYLGGVKDLPDGTLRLNTHYAVGGPDATPFSCVGTASDGRLGGPEGVIAGDHLRNPSLRLGAVALDGQAGREFCSNVAALDADLAGYPGLVYVAATRRAGEGRVASVPVSRRAGLAGFLGGETLDVTLLGVTLTVSGGLQPDGRWALTLLRAQSGSETYTAQAPLVVAVDPQRGLRTWDFTVADDELTRLADFALRAGLADRELDLTDAVVPELGLTMPPISLYLPGETLRDVIDAYSNGGSDTNPPIGG